MLRALAARDASCDGVFFAAVTTTGIFCRPSCPARNPKPENVEFYATARGALFAGFRPCRRCHPLEERGRTPTWVTELIARVEARPDERIRDADLRTDGLDPVAVRRYFQKTYGMTFQAYSRSRRLGRAFAALRAGSSLDDAVFAHGWESHSGFRSAFGKAAGLTPGRVAPPRLTSGRLTPGERGATDFIRLAWIETSLGPMVAGATERALCLLEFTDTRMIEAQLETVRRRFGLPLLAGESPFFVRLREELAQYLAGERRDFDLPMDFRGSEFQHRVWEGLLRIPYGETRSYAELAGRRGCAGRGPRGRTSERAQPHRHPDPVSPGDRRRRRSGRVRRRAVAQAPVARERGGGSGRGISWSVIRRRRSTVGPRSCRPSSWRATRAEGRLRAVRAATRWTSGGWE